MANRIKAACRAAGLEGGVFSGHGGRVGLARMMSGAGGGSGGDGPPLRQGGAGRRRPPVDGRGDGDSVVNRAGDGPGGSRVTGQETGRDPVFRLISRQSGESSCEWASRVRAQPEGSSWARAPSGFGLAGWLMDHTALLNERRELWERQGYSVLTGARNGCTLRGSGAALAGKPDPAARRRDGVTVTGAKTGRPSPRHAVQAMICRYALPRAVERRQGLRRSGQGACPGHVAETPARRVPSPMERRFCEITQADCPDRLEEGPSPEGVAGGFQHEPRRRSRERWKP